ncbi:MAG: PAS domain S-box protein [Pseudomonadota bacterium]
MLGSLIETTVDGVMAIDSAGTLFVFNPACERIFGRDKADVIGRNVSLLMTHEHAARHDGYIDHHLTTGEKRIIGVGRRVEGRRKDGSSVPLDLSVGRFEHEGAPMFVGIVRDLTAVVEDERQISSLQSQLHHMGRVGAVAEMGSALAHELNQPLTAIALYLATADRALNTDGEKARALFQRARDEALKAGDIVRRIRQMVEQGEYDPHTFGLSAAIEAAAALCRIAEGGRDADIRIEHQAPDDAYGDATQVQQVLFNLIKNGVDAAAPLRRPVVRISTNVTDALEIHVEDNGPGVSTEIAGRLFSAFATTKEKGLGIGLSICRNIAELHRGSLELLDRSPHPTPLGGAVFRLRLPTAELGDVS